jgi:hypothetical protein
VQHVKIYLPCNFEVNPSTDFGEISLFSSNLDDEHSVVTIAHMNLWVRRAKKGNKSKMDNQIYFKIAGYVDLDMLHIFAI